MKNRPWIFQVKVVLSLILLSAFLMFAATAQGATPKHGGTLIAATSGEEATLNPHISTGAANQVPVNNIYDLLVYLNFDLEPVPGLATSWEVSKDGLTYTFNLAKNATWHDGKPVTSADVLYTLKDIYPQHPRAQWWRGMAKSISLEAPDNHTVVIKLKSPFAPFLTVMAFEIGGPHILPKHLYEGTDFKKNPYNNKPIGTGPFMFKEWVKGSHIELIRNPNYFAKGKENKPYVDRLITRIIPDSSALALALKKGDVDFIPSTFVPLEEVAEFRKDPKITVDPRGDGLTLKYLFFNLRHPILSKQAVRQAIAYGMDKQKILNFALSGEGKVAKSILNSRMGWAFNSNVPEYAFDPKKANELLDKAGIARGGDGIRFKMRLHCPNRGSDPLIAEVVRDNMKPLGIDVQIVSADLATFYDSVFMRWDFDTAVQQMATAPDPSLGTSRFIHSKNIVKATMVNVMGYNNPEVDRLLDREFNQVDRKERAATWRQIQDLVMNDLPVIPIYEVTPMNTYRSTWGDIVTRFYAAGQSREDAYLKK